MKTITRGLGDNPPQATLYYGVDVIQGLQGLAASSVHMVCTSPPYYGGLRDYGVDGQLGFEDTPQEYVAKMVEIFRHVKRVLRKDGTVWLNLGDTYVTENRHADALPAKSLMGIPWRVALALQDDGWILRSDIIWSKPNPMPELVRDRPTKAHEYVFLLAHPDSKGHYFYDRDAIREPCSETNVTDILRRKKLGGRSSHGGQRKDMDFVCADLKRNKRTVWDVSPKAYAGAHFAVWPPGLVEPMILAGTSGKGYCAACGKPWFRQLDIVESADWRPNTESWEESDPESKTGLTFKTRTVGDWQPSCECSTTDITRGVVLDPFSGSGTTGEVALNLGRDYIGLDLNPMYQDMAERRILGLEPLKSKAQSDDSILSLFGEDS